MYSAAASLSYAPHQLRPWAAGDCEMRKDDGDRGQTLSRYTGCFGLNLTAVPCAESLESHHTGQGNRLRQD